MHILVDGEVDFMVTAPCAQVTDLRFGRLVSSPFGLIEARERKVSATELVALAEFLGRPEGLPVHALS